MKRSYLEDIIISAKTDKYRINGAVSYDSNIYFVDVDEDLDIFSELPTEMFSKKFDRNQMTTVMLEFKRMFYQYIHASNPRVVLPKLRYYVDDEDAHIVRLASDWKGGNASVYFSFEEDEKESSFGMIWNDQIKKNFESRSGSIFCNDIKEVINEIIEFVFRVY